MLSTKTQNPSKMTNINNVNLEALQKTREAIEKGEFPEEKEFIGEGEWLFDESGQFRGVLEFPEGTLTLVSDQPPPSGGGGRAPNPLQYCAFAVAACYATTFMTLAAMEGIKIDSLKVRAKVKVNMKAVMELEDAPVNKGVMLEVEVSSSAPESKLRELKAKADEKCPAAYTISHTVPFSSELILK